MGITTGEIVALTGVIGIPSCIFAYKLTKADIVRETIKLLDGRYMKKSDCKQAHDLNNVMLKSLHEKLEDTNILTRQILDAVLHKKNKRKAA